MAERYDVLITARDGVFPLVALPEGKKGRGLAVLRTTKVSKKLPPVDVRPHELDGETVPARRLLPADSVALGDRDPDREMRIRITGTMRRFDWGFDHKPYSAQQRHPVRAGERVRLTLINATDMWHPMHLHGHTFAVVGLDSVGARKDTALVLPHRKLVIDFDADNPGLWMLHCHNQYHLGERDDDGARLQEVTVGGAPCGDALPGAFQLLPLQQEPRHRRRREQDRRSCRRRQVQAVDEGVAGRGEQGLRLVRGQVRGALHRGAQGLMGPGRVPAGPAKPR